MENKQPIQQPVQQPTVPQPSMPLKTKLQNLKANLIIKFNALSKNTKMLVIVMAVLFLIIFLLSILVALFGKKQTVIVATPTPAPLSVSPTPEVILNASRYATDSGVLKIETDLRGFQNDLNSKDVRQTDLTPPTLDFNITFN